MKKISCIAAGAMLTAISGIAVADGHEGASLAYPPMEAFTCNYNEGMGPADLDAATDAWNEWMDDEDVHNYFAATMTPYYHGAETFDVGWIGSWTDGNAMGEGTDRWLAEGGELAAGFGAAVTCDTHANFAIDTIHGPSGDTPDTFVLTFSDCNITEGTSYEDLRAGLVAWAEYQAENGHDHPAWVLWPVYGGGDAEFDFKLMEGYENHAELGMGYEMYGTGGAWVKHMETVAGMYECDESRVYNGRTRRVMGDD